MNLSNEELASLIVRGEIINYFYSVSGEVEEAFQDILIPSGYVETLKDDVKLLVLGR